MAPSSKANYKSYEAQARLVRAIVAAHPEVKWNYKEIVACYGSDMSEDALNHRWRRLRAETIIVREGRAAGLDPKQLPVSEDLPKTQGGVDRINISKYFGQSTPDGVQFQFRTIKKDADTLRRCEAAGGDVANCLTSLPAGAGSNSSFSTPAKQAAPRAAPRGSGAGTGSRRSTAKRPAAGSNFIKRSDSDMEEDDDDDVNNSSENWSGKDVEETPSKRTKQESAATPRKKTTPSRRAATKANATIAAESQLQVDEDSPEEHAAFDSIFGDVGVFKPEVHMAGFSANGQDMYLPDDLSSYVDMDNLMGDGEI